MSEKTHKPAEELPERWPHTSFGDEFLGFDEMEVSSANECTGLMPALPISNEEADSYNDIYGVPTPFEKWNSDNNIGVTHQEKINSAKKSALD